MCTFNVHPPTKWYLCRNSTYIYTCIIVMFLWLWSMLLSNKFFLVFFKIGYYKCKYIQETWILITPSAKKDFKMIDVLQNEIIINLMGTKDITPTIIFLAFQSFNKVFYTSWPKKKKILYLKIMSNIDI